MVAWRGFEPPIFALRGRCPKPLDDQAICGCAEMAGVEGVEPSHTAPETAVLPLDDTPMRIASSAGLNITVLCLIRQLSFQNFFENIFRSRLAEEVSARRAFDQNRPFVVDGTLYDLE